MTITKTKTNIDENILKEFIEQELKFWISAPVIKNLTYIIRGEVSTFKGDYIEYTYTIGLNNERNYGLMPLKQYIQEKREKSLKKIL